MENKHRNPIFYKSSEEMDKPISKLIEEIRSQIGRLRGKLSDIRSVSGFDEWIQPYEGGLTCMISALHNLQEQFKALENKDLKEK